MVADRQVGHALAHGLHDTRSLMAQDDGLTLVPQPALSQPKVGVTDAGGCHPDQDLPGMGRVQKHLLHA